MTQDTLTQSEPGMTPQERDLNQHLTRAIAIKSMPPGRQPPNDTG